MDFQEQKSNFEHKVQKSMSSVLAIFEYLMGRTRLFSLNESCSSSSQLSKEFWMTSFRYPSEVLWPKYDNCAELERIWRTNTGFSAIFGGQFFIHICSWKIENKKRKSQKKKKKEIIWILLAEKKRKNLKEKKGNCLISLAKKEKEKLEEKKEKSHLYNVHTF